MPVYISEMTSEVVVQPAGGLTQEQMQEIVKAVLKALEEKERQMRSTQNATQINNRARPATQFE